MSKLSHFKNQYLNKNIQFILTDKNAVVLDSDQTILSIASNTSIFDIHPFFECIADLETSDNAELAFNCVNIAVEKEDLHARYKNSKKTR